MKIEKRTIGGIAVLDIKGKLSRSDSAKELQEQVGELIRKGHVQILLCMSACRLVSSHGAIGLVRSHTAVGRAKGQIKLCRLPEKVQQQIEMSMPGLFPIFDSEDAAVKSFK